MEGPALDELSADRRRDRGPGDRLRRRRRLSPTSRRWRARRGAQHRGRDRRPRALRAPFTVAEAHRRAYDLTPGDGPEARHPLPRRRRRPRRQGHQLRRPARRRRPGRAGRALRRRGRRRARLPRHHRLAREARDDRRAGPAHRRQRLHPVHDRRRHPLGRGRAGGARRRRRQGLGQLRGAGPARSC